MTALDDIAAERRRQIEAEGWTAEHDDGHSDFELSRAAACYAMAPWWRTERNPPRHSLNWPWFSTWWKPTDDRRDLVKAAALIVAEIERLDRLGRVL